MLLPHHHLTESLRTGFIDQTHTSKKEYLPQLLINNREKGKKVLTTVLRELRQCDEFLFSVAFVTKSGIATLINELIELEVENIKGKVLVSQYLNFTQPEALRTLLQFKNIDLRIVVDGNFHAKGYLFKKGAEYSLIIGSSNLTANALCANKEWNLKVSSTENGALVKETIDEFYREFSKAIIVDRHYLEAYEKIFTAQRKAIQAQERSVEQLLSVRPNSMQKEALQNLANLRNNGIAKALLISATGTGKTYLSAFDVKAVNPDRFLFIVHRANIAEAAMKSFKRVFGNGRTMGMYSGERKDMQADFLFSTVQTISKDSYLYQFESSHFDYLVIDETHRAGAESYQKILKHFKPKFLLGMTATPERTDGFDIFKQFDYNIAYEIRLHKALEEEMLCPFHYYGVTDISVNNEPLTEDATFNLLTADERVERIIEKAKLYGCDNGKVRGLVFCSKVEESRFLSKAFNERGYRTIALSGDNSEAQRAEAITRLEIEGADQLDYIFTVDIFNEGIDIPRVNQIIMLRPTQSAIVFVQQLGRGLRKTDNKEYVTVIDFIGNYNNNYLVPIALYGDTTYNKDTLRKLMASGSSLIPGASTVNFDKIARERVFAAIDTANLSTKKDLAKDYQLLKFEIGRIPMMMDFIEHGSRDPYLYVDYSKSYFNFVASQETSLSASLTPKAIKLLELFSNNIADAKRVEEVIIITQLLDKGSISTEEVKSIVYAQYDTVVSDATIASCIRNLNFEFINASEQVVYLENQTIVLEEEFKSHLNNSTFQSFLKDLLAYAKATYDKHFDRNRYIDGFILYQKYSRKDVLRILNWHKNLPPLNIGGYIVHPEKTSCPIFVTYKKREEITHSVKYEDKFLNSYELQTLSKPKRTLNSPEIVLMRNNGSRFPLFIQKSNDEGVDFYYMGDITPKENGFIQDKIPSSGGKNVDIVTITFSMNIPVEDALYEYITLDSK